MTINVCVNKQQMYFHGWKQVVKKGEVMKGIVEDAHGTILLINAKDIRFMPYDETYTQAPKTNGNIH